MATIDDAKAALAEALVSTRPTYLKPEELATLISAIADAVAERLAVSDSKIAAILNGAPTAFDTFAEFYAQLTTDEASLAALITSVSSKLAKASNLSDLASTDAALTNLGASATGKLILAIASYSALKAALGITSGDVSGLGSLATASSVTASQISDASANGRSLITAASYAAMRTALSLVPGTDVQAYNALLASVAALNIVSGDLIYGSGAGAVSRLAKGTDGQILQLAAGIPSWTTPTSGLAIASSTAAKAGVDNSSAMTPYLVELVRGPDVRALAMMVSELKGDRINMPDGFFDPFADSSDVGTITNTALSSGAFTALGAAQALDPTVHGSLAVLSNSNRDFTLSSTASTTFVRGAALLPSTGKWYWEITNLVANPYLAQAGIAPGTDNFTTTPLATAYGCVWSQYGPYNNSYISGNSDTYSAWAGMSAPSALNDVFMIAYDADNGKLWFGKNGTWWNSSGTANPATGTDPRYTGIAAGNMYLYLGAYYTPYASLRLNAGQAAYSYSPPSGFNGMGTPLNLTLISNAFTAAATPSRARLTVQALPVVAITINTDLLGYVSRDGGTTWTQATLAAETVLADGTTLYVHDGLDISGQPSGTSMKYKVVTANNKQVNISGVGLRWAA